MGWRKALRDSADAFQLQISEAIAASGASSVILCSSMTNAQTIKNDFPEIPVVLFMHENQLGYPGSELPNKFAQINWQSLSAADLAIFNSKFHLNQLPELLPKIGVEPAQIQELTTKSVVGYVGIDPELFELSTRQGEAPLILFNQRWEEDKRPDVFLEACVQLKSMGYEFELALCGEHYPGRYQVPDLLRERIKFEGCLPRETYKQVLAETDIVVSTSVHEYFGVAVAEAIAAGAIPCLPNRLSYPELLPESAIELLYDDNFAAKLRDLLDTLEVTRIDYQELLRAHLHQFKWEKVALGYDNTFSSLAVST